MAQNINQLDYFSLYLGGLNGGVYVAANTAKTGLKRHLIEVLENGATFTVLSAIDQDGDAVDMTAAGTNNFGVREYNTGDLVYAPDGGYITAYTCDKATQHYAIPTSNRKQQV